MKYLLDPYVIGIMLKKPADDPAVKNFSQQVLDHYQLYLQELIVQFLAKKGMSDELQNKLHDFYEGKLQEADMDADEQLTQYLKMLADHEFQREIVNKTEDFNKIYYLSAKLDQSQMDEIRQYTKSQNLANEEQSIIVMRGLQALQDLGSAGKDVDNIIDKLTDLVSNPDAYTEGNVPSQQQPVPNQPQDQQVANTQAQDNSSLPPQIGPTPEQLQRHPVAGINVPPTSPSKPVDILAQRKQEHPETIRPEALQKQQMQPSGVPASSPYINNPAQDPVSETPAAPVFPPAQNPGNMNIVDQASPQQTELEDKIAPNLNLGGNRGGQPVN